MTIRCKERFLGKPEKNDPVSPHTTVELGSSYVRWVDTNSSADLKNHTLLTACEEYTYKLQVDSPDQVTKLTYHNGKKVQEKPLFKHAINREPIKVWHFSDLWKRSLGRVYFWEEDTHSIIDEESDNPNDALEVQYLIEDAEKIIKHGRREEQSLTASHVRQLLNRQAHPVISHH